MSESLKDILEIIPEEEFSQCCNIISEELPASVYVYNFFITCHDWRKKNPDYKVIFYRYREDKETGIFAALLYTGNKTFGLVLYAREGNEDLLKQVLLSTTKIPWDQLPVIKGIMPRHFSLIQDVVRKKQFEPKLYGTLNIMLLDKEMALNYKINCPQDVFVRRLTLDDADSIYELWPHKDVATIDALNFSIRSNISYGLVSRENNELQAWVMLAYYGGISMLYVKENARRRGYAKSLIMLIAKELVEIGITPYALIHEENVNSIKLFRSIGFEPICSESYLRVDEAIHK